MATVGLGPYHFRALFGSRSSVCGRAVGRCCAQCLGCRHTHLVHLLCVGLGVCPGRGQASPKLKLSSLFFAGGRQSKSRVMARRALTTRSLMLVWTCCLMCCQPDSSVSYSLHATRLPHVEPPALSNLLQPLALSLLPKLSCSAVPQACHSDHAYQPSEATDRNWGQVSEHSGEKQYRGCGSFQRCLTTWG